MTKKPPATDGDKAKLFTSLRELRNDRLVPFTYGPLYVYGQVPFSILDRFAEEVIFNPLKPGVVLINTERYELFYD